MGPLSVQQSCCTVSQIQAIYYLKSLEFWYITNKAKWELFHNKFPSNQFPICYSDREPIFLKSKKKKKNFTLLLAVTVIKIYTTVFTFYLTLQPF